MPKVTVTTRDMVYLGTFENYACFLTSNKTFYAPNTDYLMQNIGGQLSLISTDKKAGTVSNATEIRDALFNIISDGNNNEYSQSKRGMSLSLKKSIVLSMLNKDTWNSDGIVEVMFPEGEVTHVNNVLLDNNLATWNNDTSSYEYPSISRDTREALHKKIANYILGINGICTISNVDVTYFGNTFAYNFVAVPIDNSINPNIAVSLKNILVDNFTEEQLHIIYSAVAKIDGTTLLDNNAGSYPYMYSGYIYGKGTTTSTEYTTTADIYTEVDIYVKVPGASVVPAVLFNRLATGTENFFNVSIDTILESSTADYNIMRVHVTTQPNNFIFKELQLSEKDHLINRLEIAYDLSHIYAIPYNAVSNEVSYTRPTYTLYSNEALFGWEPVEVMTVSVPIYLYRGYRCFVLSSDNAKLAVTISDSYIDYVYNSYSGKYTRNEIVEMLTEDNDLNNIISRVVTAQNLIPNVYIPSNQATGYEQLTGISSSFGNAIINDDLTLVPAEKTELLKWSVSHKADDVYKSSITKTYGSNQYTKMIFNDMKDKVFISNTNKSSDSKVSFLFYVASVNAALLDKYSELIDATSNTVDSESNSVMKLDGSGLAKVTSANLLLNGATFMQYIDNSFFSDVQPKIANNMIATVTPIHNNYFYMFISIAGSTSIMALKFASIAQNNTYTFSICDATDLAQIFNSHSGNVWSSPKAWTGLAGATTATLTGSGYVITVDGYAVTIANTFNTGTSSIEYSTDYSDEIYLQFSVNVPYTNCKGTVPALTVNSNNTQFDCQDGIVTFTINGNNCTLNMLTGIIEYADDAFQLNTTPDSVTGIFEYMQYCTVSSIFEGVYKVTSAGANEYTVSSNGVIRGDLNFTVEEIDE